MHSAWASQIGIVVFSDVEELDAIGPWEVLSYWTRNYQEDGHEVSVLSRDGQRATCAKGLTIEAHYSFASAPPLDVLVYPGGRNTRPQLADDDVLRWVRHQRERVPLMTSVCTRIAGLCRGRVPQGEAGYRALGFAGSAG